jgi:WD40 repeat protein
MRHVRCILALLSSALMMHLTPKSFVSAQMDALSADYQPITVDTIERLQEIRRLPIRNYIVDIAFHPSDSSILAVAEQPGGISIWSILNGQMLTRWDDGLGRLTSIHYSSNGRYLVALYPDAALVEVRDAENNYALLRQIVFEDERPQHMDIGRDSLLAVAYWSKTRLWDVETGEMLIELIGLGTPPYALDLYEPSTPAPYSPTRLYLGYSTWNGLIIQYTLDDVSSGDVYFFPYTGGNAEISALQWSPILNGDSRVSGLLTVASHSGTLDVWLELAMYAGDTNGPTRRIPLRYAYPHTLDINSTGTLVAITGKEDTAGGRCVPGLTYNVCSVQVIDTRTGEIRFYSRIVVYQYAVFSGDDRILATASRDGAVILWGVRG